MCIIINNPTGSPLLPLRLETARKNNRDGAGFMWHDQTTGRVQTLRGMFSTNEILDMHRMLEGTPHAIHMRYRTRGPVGVDACHPFQILSEEEHGVDLYMMHNGTLSAMPSSKTDSDTMLFAQRLREKISAWDNPLDLMREHVLARMGKTIGDNRLVFYASGGLTAIVNAKTGWFECPERGALEIDTVDGMATPTWYANQYSFSGLDPATWYTTPKPRPAWTWTGKGWRDGSGVDWQEMYKDAE
jgi:hypothetical protein